MENVNIIYEDSEILVCHKQAGIAVQTRRVGQADMESKLKNYCISQGEDPYIGIIHRLDQPVEGLIVFAKNPAAAANLSRQVATRQIAKYYYALVHMSENSKKDKFQREELLQKESQKKGLQAEESAWVTLTDYLVRDGKTNTSRVVSETAPGAKRAVLEYRTLKCSDGIALVDIHLRTGRHHQIRVQMAHAGMPLVGDQKYGGSKTEESAWNLVSGNRKEDNQRHNVEVNGKPGLALCAYRLEFTHPASGEKMSFEITPPWCKA